MLASNVIGPVSASAKERLEDWFTMRELKEDIKFCRKTDPEGYRTSIEKSTEYYKKFLGNYVKGKIT